MTTTVTLADGTVTTFMAVDHATAECVGIHAAKSGNRFEALEAIRQVVRECFGGYAAQVAAGVSVRHDHGSAYLSDVSQDELRFLGAASSPAFVREPDGNGWAERFIRTLQENLLWVRSFTTVEELRQALLAFKTLFNRTWLIERHGFNTPAQARKMLKGAAARIPPPMYQGNLVRCTLISEVEDLIPDGQHACTRTLVRITCKSGMELVGVHYEGKPLSIGPLATYAKLFAIMQAGTAKPSACIYQARYFSLGACRLTYTNRTTQRFSQ